MTKMHFEGLAIALKHAKPENNQPKGFKDKLDTAIHDTLVMQWKTDCEFIAEACKSFNPAFNKERFLKACGYL